MSDGSLTQDEIDALLQGSPSFDLGGGDAGGASLGGAAESLSDAEKKAFQSVLQGTIGSQGSNLSMLVTKTSKFLPPKVDVMGKDQILGALEDEVVQISLNFTEGLSGDHFYIIPQSMATAIAGLMMGQEGVELNEAALSALQEAMSQVSGPIITALGDKAKTTVMTSPAEARLVPKEGVAFPDGEFVVATYPSTIEGEMPADVIEVFTVAQVQEVVKNAAGGPAAPAAAKASDVNPFGAAPAPRGPAPAMPQMNPMMGGMGMAPNPMMGMSPPNVQSVQFPNLQSGGFAQDHGNISLLMDVYMEMTVELGRTKKLIKEILGMGEGTIIELDKLAGEPVDILVNHKLIAKGEVVVIDENFGVRVTEIVSPMERMKDMT